MIVRFGIADSTGPALGGVGILTVKACAAVPPLPSPTCTATFNAPVPGGVQAIAPVAALIVIPRGNRVRE